MKNIALVLMIVLSSTFLFSQEEKRPEPVLCGLGETLWYPDQDGDGYGHPTHPICSVDQPVGYVADNTDCNDNDKDYHDVGYIQYRDQDGDGFGNPDFTIVACMPIFGFVSNNEDLCPDVNGPNRGCPDITLGENYIYTTTYLVPTENGEVNSDDKIESITYYDGLGRAKQTISKQAGGNNEDVVTPIVYDNFGRKALEYLPYARQDFPNLNIEDPLEILNQINVQYQMKYPEDLETTTNPYSEKVFEASPLNRVIEQASAGSDWAIGNGHTIKFNYQTNTLDTSNPTNPNNDNVKRFSVSHYENNKEKTKLLFDEYYQANQLYKTIIKDENHDSSSSKNHTLEKFKNKQGNIILKRLYNNNEIHDTYYVYDDFGNLTYVIPPKASYQIINGGPISLTIIEALCYIYHYDYRNRLIEKKIPGKGWEYIVYDKMDRPILTQDANLRRINKWLFTKYDILGRVAYTGIHNFTPSQTAQDNTGRLELQGEVDDPSRANIVWYEVRSQTIETINGTSIYYSHNSYPQIDLDILTINYYDSYEGLNVSDIQLAPNTVIYDEAITSSVKSLPTYNQIRVLGTDQWITSVIYYDEDANPIYKVNKNDYLVTVDKVKSDLDFVGKVMQSESSHKKGNDPIIEVRDIFTYDHAGRMLTQKQQINNNPFEYISNNIYDGLGQLTSKGVGGTEGSSLQSVDYKYNIRGWLKQINDVDNLGHDLFGFKINYNTSEYSGDELYNGNISETIWNTKSVFENPINNNVESEIKRAYSYGYDHLNRINTGLFKEAGTVRDNHYNLNLVEYDKNGNITTLNRGGVSNEGVYTQWMDHLSYEYNGNQLKNVIETGHHQLGFKDGTNIQSLDYKYDVNGNMIKDYNKGIDRITYNHLNLPVTIEFDNGSYINYTYNATGIKLDKKVIVPNGIVYKETVTSYASNYIYEKNIVNSNITERLKFFNHPEGYVEPNNSGNFDYIYQYKDHLGNIRLSYGDSDNDGAISEAGVFYDDIESASGWDSEGALHGGTVTAYDDAFKYSGEYSAKISTLSGGSKYVHSNSWTPIGNNQPTEYTYSGWAYSDGPGIRVLLFMNENEETSYFTQIDEYRDYTSKNTWVYFEKTVTVPSNIDKLNIRIESFHGTPGSVWYDNVKIKKVGSEIIEENNYYPFGLKHKGYNTVINGTNHKYGFGGKEEQDELGLGWLDVTARNYDPAIGRWMNLDPLAEEMTRHSPYNFSFNNPIFFQDYDGMSPSASSDVYNQVNSFFSGMMQDAETLAASQGKDSRARERLAEKSEALTKAAQIMEAYVEATEGAVGFLPYGEELIAVGKGVINEDMEGAAEDYIKNRVDNVEYEIAGAILPFVDGGDLRKIGKYASKVDDVANTSKKLPIQIHHFATNKNKTFTPKMAGIANEFGLGLNGAWNKQALPHLGRHPNAYHNFVLDGMQKASAGAGGSQSEFLNLFNQYVIQPVIQNPGLLRKSGW